MGRGGVGVPGPDPVTHHIARTGESGRYQSPFPRLRFAGRQAATADEKVIII